MNIEDMISAVQKKVGVQVDGRAGTKTWGPIIGDVQPKQNVFVLIMRNNFGVTLIAALSQVIGARLLFQ